MPVRCRCRGRDFGLGLFGAAGGGHTLDTRIAVAGGTRSGRCRSDQPRGDTPAAKKNCIKPWRKLMWCVGRLTEEYRQLMYDLLELYARPFRSREPVVWLDEKSKQLLEDSRRPLPIRPGMRVKVDYEYVRRGTCNLFVAIEPKGGRRTVGVTDHRTKAVRPPPARTGLCQRSPGPSGARQSQHAFPKMLRGSARRRRRAQVAAPRGLSLSRTSRNQTGITIEG